MVTGDSREQEAKVRHYLAAHPDRMVALLATAENAPVYQQMRRRSGIPDGTAGYRFMWRSWVPETVLRRSPAISSTPSGGVIRPGRK